MGNKTELDQKSFRLYQKIKYIKKEERERNVLKRITIALHLCIQYIYA